MDKPVIKQDPLYKLLRNEDIKGFNEQRDKLHSSELASGDYRGRDLRNILLANVERGQLPPLNLVLRVIAERLRKKRVRTLSGSSCATSLP